MPLAHLANESEWMESKKMTEEAPHQASGWLGCCKASGGILQGQAATEILVLAGFALAFILPLAFLFLSVSQSELSKSSLLQAKISARTIAEEAGELYLQGPGAKKFIFVNFPEGVVNGSAEGGLVVLSLESEGRRQDVVSQTFANVSGYLPGRRTAGLQRLKLEYVYPGDYVDIRYNDTG